MECTVRTKVHVDVVSVKEGLFVEVRKKQIPPLSLKNHKE
jgi:hypothetical protein